MDDEKGWIKIHRSIFRNPWMLRPNVLAVWMYILGRVNWRPTDVVFEGKRITLQPGQGIFKVLEIAADLRIPETTTRRIVNLLKSEGQIGVQTSPRNTLITVVNWSKYQLVGGQNGGQVADKRRTSGGQTADLPIIKEAEEGEEAKHTREQTFFPAEVNEAERYLTDHVSLLVAPEKERLQAVISRYGMDAFKYAVQIMAQRGGRSIKYLETILNDPQTMAGAANDSDSGSTEEDIYEILK